MPESTAAAKPVTVRCLFCETLNRVDLTRLANRPKCAQCGRPIRLDVPVKATESDFDRTVQTAAVPVLADFYADWCAPCRMMAPTVDSLAHDRAGEILVLKVDTDANPQLAQRFGIRGIPTVISFRDGKEHRRHVGAADRETLDRLLV
ncbi:MAG TPA: thioredoxin [Gemmatimonadales bacterium]|nr:thioredoxin [Gemmatimonadales bacterium]